MAGDAEHPLPLLTRGDMEKIVARKLEATHGQTHSVRAQIIVGAIMQAQRERNTLTREHLTLAIFESFKSDMGFGFHPSFAEVDEEDKARWRRITDDILTHMETLR